MTFHCSVCASYASKATNDCVDYSSGHTLRSFLLLLFNFPHWLFLVIAMSVCVSALVTIVTTTSASTSIASTVGIVSPHKVVLAPLLNELFNLILQNYALFSGVAVSMVFVFLVVVDLASPKHVPICLLEGSTLYISIVVSAS